MMSRFAFLFFRAVCLVAAWGALGWAGESDASEPGETVVFHIPQETVFELEATSPALLASRERPQWIRAKCVGRPVDPVQGSRLPWTVRRWMAPHLGEGDEPRAASEPEVVEFGSRVALQVAPGADARRLITESGVAVSRAPAPGLFVLQAADARAAVRAATWLSRQAGIVAAYPVLRRAARFHGPYAPAPSDPNFAVLYHGVVGQWYLEDLNVATGARRGVDLNVRAAWPRSNGGGITVAVADVGIEFGHPDLVSRLRGGPHHSFVDGTTNSAPLGTSADWAHGTAAASLIAAEGNNGYGMIGVAPGATLASWLVVQQDSAMATDEGLMDMFAFATNIVSVQNHSWGVDGIALGGPTLLQQAGLDKAFRDGRGGRGTVMVRSAGNDRKLVANANDDAYPSDPRVITVAAVTREGPVSDYSEPGACILVGAPANEANGSGLFAADLSGPNGMNPIGFFPPNEYLSNFAFHSLGFSGTSASAPLVAGVAALVLAANTNLTYRDVQQILLLASRHFDFADVDLRTNGAGFLVSHNAGFGVPDAGVAVANALKWPLRAAQSSVTLTNTIPVQIPDDGLRLVVTGDDVPASLTSVRVLPSLGPHPDSPTPSVPLVDVGVASSPLADNLTGKAALVARGAVNFATKIRYAAQAGAAFALIHNVATNSGSGCPGGDQLCALGGTDFTPIPAAFIGYGDGRALADLFATNPTARAQLRLQTADVVFGVTNTLLCEHVGVRLQTDHPLRGDLRITLLSPQGTRSVLQRYNSDTNAGPTDWTYWSTHHFYESSAGAWTLSVADEVQTMTGSVRLASLILTGVEIVDTDADGLDDGWEIRYFGNLAQGPQGDPDGDGSSNAREQVLGTHPGQPDQPLEVNLSQWSNELGRLSWPSLTNRVYEVLAGTNLLELTPFTNVVAIKPEIEWFTPLTNSAARFFRVRLVD